jgi:AraC family transcriptional regulator
MILQSTRIDRSDPVILAGRNSTFHIGPSPGIKDLWARFMEDFGKIEGQVGWKSYGVCHNFDGKGMMDYMAAVAVADEGKVPGYLFTLKIPARKVAVFAHHGPIDDISKTWARIFEEGLPASKLTVAPGPQFEVYPADMGEAGATTPIEIHIPIM